MVSDPFAGIQKISASARPVGTLIHSSQGLAFPHLVSQFANIPLIDLNIRAGRHRDQVRNAQKLLELYNIF